MKGRRQLHHALKLKYFPPFFYIFVGKTAETETILRQYMCLYKTGPLYCILNKKCLGHFSTLPYSFLTHYKFEQTKTFF